MSVPQKINIKDKLQQQIKENKEKPEQQLKPLIPAVTNTMGKELCVPTVNKRLEDLNKDVNKIALQSFTDKMTFDILKNSGVTDPYKSTLGKKIRTSQGKEKYLNDVKIINDFLGKRGEDGMLFIKNIPSKIMSEIVGYEIYTGNAADNIGFGKNPREWDKWDDENILELARQGAEVTWYGVEKIEENNEEYLGELTYYIQSADSDIFRKIEEDIKNNKFSFHSVYIPDGIPVIKKIKDLADQLKDKPIITEPEEERQQRIINRMGEYGSEKRTGIKEFFPVNSAGKFVVTDMLENPPEIAIWSLGTGLMNLRGEGVHNSNYQGVLIIDDVMKLVLGEENYIYITGTPVRIKINNEITVQNRHNKFARPRIYKPGELIVIRGLYIDALGKFKIGQVATNIQIGTTESEATRNATAQQLLIRQMVTRAYPVFRTLTKDEYKTIQSMMNGLISLLGIQGKQDIITTQLIREKEGEKQIGGGKRKLINGNEIKSIEMEQEEKPRRIQYEEIVGIIQDQIQRIQQGEDRREPEKRMITEKKLTIQEESMNVEKTADVHYHDINGEYIGVNREEQREIEQQMEQERKEE